MRSAHRPLYVLHSDPVLREQIHRAGAEHFRCTEVPGWEALSALLETAPPAAVSVVDPYAENPGRRELSDRLHALLRCFPAATILAALEVEPGRIHDLRTLGEWGIADVIALDGRDTTESIARKLRTAEGRPLRSLLDHSLPALLSARGRAILDAAVELSATGGTGRDLADALHLSERALLRWCERARVPPPRRVLAWMRVLRAAELLDHPEMTVLMVAHTCGYATDSSLRRALQEFTGHTPSTLKARGAFAVAADAFVRELVHLRGDGEMVSPHAA